MAFVCGMGIDHIVAANIRRMRLEKALSQETLADEAGVTRSHLGALERGERSATVRLLSRVAKVLQTTVAQLVTEQHEPMPSNLPRGRRRK